MQLPFLKSKPKSPSLSSSKPENVLSNTNDDQTGSIEPPSVQLGSDRDDTGALTPACFGEASQYKAVGS